MTTLKEILEDGYGIDFSTLKFKTKDDNQSTDRVNEILKSMETNELIMDLFDKSYVISECDIDDHQGKLIMYAD